MPFFNPERSIIAFGLPAHIATSKPAQKVMILNSARTTATGIALMALYASEKLAAMDIVFASMGYLGIVDGYVCWKEGGNVGVRASSGLLMGLWGVLGLTAGRR